MPVFDSGFATVWEDLLGRLSVVGGSLVRKAGEVGSMKDRLRALEEDNRQLKLVVASLLEHMVAKGLATREELTAQANQIDAIDGKVDGAFDGKVDIQAGPTPKPPEPERSPLDELKRVVEEG
jgi:hypothetical protein